MTKRKMCRYSCGRQAENETATRCRTCRRNDKKAGRPVRHDVAPGGPRVLLVDIETSPHIVYRFGKLYKPQAVSINQVIRDTEVLSVAAKWLGEPDVLFFSQPKNGRLGMLRKVHQLLNEAEAVVHYYGQRFDTPHLFREFVQHGLTPPSPFRQVDLKQAVSRRFEFPSDKLQFVSQALGLEGKVQHEGFDLWPACMNGDPDAWARMEEYNCRDTVLLEEVYETLLPWIPGLPNRHLYGDDGCPACGADTVEPNGVYRTPLSAYSQYCCGSCGSWFRDSKRLYGVDIQAAAL